MDNDINKAVEKVIAGDRDAYWTIVNQYKLMVRSYVASILFNQSDIDDLTQETFITAYKKLSEFDSSKNFGSWIRGIARFKMTNYMRATKRRGNLMGNFKEKVIDIISPEIEQKLKAESDHSIKALLTCISKLPQNMRLVVKSGLNGIKAQNLAEEINSTPGAIYNLQYRANGLLRDCVKKGNFDMKDDLKLLLKIWLSEEEHGDMDRLLEKLQDDSEFRSAFTDEVIMMGKIKAVTTGEPRFAMLEEILNSNTENTLNFDESIFNKLEKEEKQKKIIQFAVMIAAMLIVAFLIFKPETQSASDRPIVVMPQKPLKEKVIQQNLNPEEQLSGSDVIAIISATSNAVWSNDKFRYIDTLKKEKSNFWGALPDWIFFLV